MKNKDSDRNELQNKIDQSKFLKSSESSIQTKQLLKSTYREKTTVAAVDDSVDNSNDSAKKINKKDKDEKIKRGFYLKKLLFGFLTKWRQYAQISNLMPIMRRYFVMNAFDGVLTAMGLIIGSFMIYLSDPTLIDRESIVIPGLSTTLAIGISGIIGAFLSETAERRKLSLELENEMAEIEEEEEDQIEINEEDYYPKVNISEEDLAKINGEPIEYADLDLLDVNESEEKEYQILEEKLEKELYNVSEEMEQEDSISEKAEKFASIVLSLTDGISPALGSIFGLLPFFFYVPHLATFILSFILEGAILFLLGVYLAKISEESKVKYGFEMLLAGIITIIVSTLIGGAV
ncbi:MAG: VIT1/CCC1 transporter family protein [Promethearchaeota archaeon]